jgi:hypothetical protein
MKRMSTVHALKPKPTGRPSTFTDEIAATICERMADGEALADICKADDMPGRRTVYQWLAANAGFARMYARARDERADLLADEIIKIADDDTKTPEHRRVQIDARKWAAAKLNPKRYSDRLQHVGDADADPIRITRIEHVIVDPANGTEVPRRKHGEP